MRLNSSSDTSGFVAGDLRDQDGISAFGAVVRVSRLNLFSRAEQFAAFGFRMMQTEDPTRVLTFSDKRKAALSASLGCSPDTVAAWNIDAWMPFAGAHVWRNLPWQLRICPCCMRHGYHSLLFQMPWMARCPWHRTRLIDACRACKQPFMDASTGTRLWMQCGCDLDFVNASAALRGERRLVSQRRELIAGYLSWAKQQRETTALISPEEPDAWGLDAMAALVDASPLAWPIRDAMSGKCGSLRPHRRTFGTNAHGSATPVFTDAVRRCAASFTPGPAGLADLPRGFFIPLTHVTQSVLRGVPLSAFNQKENAAFFRSPDKPDSTLTTLRELLFLPVYECGAHVYLDLQTLQRSALRTVCEFSTATLDPVNTGERSSSRCQRLALGVIRQLLARAYADGLTHVVGRHAPAVFDNRRIRSGPRMPWIAVVRGNDGIHRVRAVWSPRRPWPDRT